MVTFDRRILLQFSRQISYKQGQIIGKHREYFYFIDNNGQLFLDDMKIKNFTSSYKGLCFFSYSPLSDKKTIIITIFIHHFLK